MKHKKGAYDYGKCHVCGEQMKEQLIRQDFWVKGKLMVIEDVPAGVCPQCGEKVVKAEVGNQIAEAVVGQKRRSKIRTISVPVYKFTKEVA